MALGVLAVVLIAWRWDAFASAESPAEALAEALAEEVDVEASSVLWWGGGGALRYRSALFRGRVGDQKADLYYAACRVSEDGDLFGCYGLSNLTRTGSADESAPLALAGHFAVYASRVGDLHDAVTILDLRGEPEGITEGWSQRTRAQNAVTNLQQTGRLVGIGRRRYSLREPSERLVFSQREGRLVIGLDEGEVEIDPTVAEPVAGADAVEFRPSEKGEPGTITWVVDTVRDLSFVGPEPIAWLEHRVFGVKDWFQRQWYAIAGSTDTEAEVADELGLEEVSEAEQRRRAELSVTDPELGWPPAPAVPVVDRPAEGEGEWIPIVADEFVQGYPGAPPTFFSTFLQVDPERPFTRVYVAIWDPRMAQLRIMTGTQEPESATGETGPGMVPRDDETLGRVVAGFNGGFQALHGEFGMMSEERIYLPPKPWAATVAVYDDGRVAMGSWTNPPEGRRHYAEQWAIEQIPDGMVEFRQNLTSVVENGRWNPWRRWYWGAAPRGDDEQAYIDRSGLCLTEEGFLAYFWGKSMGAEELGKAMNAVRCVRGMHLDMNQRHTAFELYRAYREGESTLDRRLRNNLEFDIEVPYADGWRVRGRKLVRTMTPMRFPRYIRRDPRDFFYITVKPVLPGPPLDGASDEEGTFETRGLPHAGWPHAFARTHLGAQEDARTWFVRIDPQRAEVPALAGAAPRGENGEEGLRRPLAYLSNARNRTAGSHGLFATRGAMGWRFAVGQRPEGATMVFAGDALTAQSDAAIGVDGDGFWVYAERRGDPTPLPERMAAAGVEAAVALPSEVRLAFVIDDLTVAPDAYERVVDVERALPLWANERPASEVLFPDVEPRPYMYWGPMQDSRVRYFRGEHTPRFNAPEEQ